MPVRDTFPKHLGTLTFNSKSGRYEITEHGVTYHLTLEHAKSVSPDFRSIAEWYDSLSKFTKAQIWRTEETDDSNKK